jgi:hypothetical protein
MSDITFVPKFDTFVKLWGKNVKPMNKESFVISNYNGKLSGQIELICFIRDHPQIDDKDIYLLCPQYVNSSTDQLEDVQFTVTGSMAKNENCQESAIRELAEEIGIIIEPSILQSFDQKISQTWNKTIYNFTCYLNDLSTVKTYKDGTYALQIENDIVSKKIQILIHGDLNFLLKLANSIDTPLYSKDSDRTKNPKTFLGGFRIVHINDIIDCYNINMSLLIKGHSKQPDCTNDWRSQRTHVSQQQLSRSDTFGQQRTHISQQQPSRSNTFGQQQPSRSDTFGQQQPSRSDTFGQQQQPSRSDTFAQQRTHISQQQPSRSDTFGQQQPSCSNPWRPQRTHVSPQTNNDANSWMLSRTNASLREQHPLPS